MLNSIHLAKWLMQFQDRELDIYLFPSSYFKKLHPQILDLVQADYLCRYIVPKPHWLYGIADYLWVRRLSPLLNRYSRVERLKRAVSRIEPQIVHAVEFQHAGYLCLDLIKKYGKNFELIVTNWGSDIYHFGQLPEHASRIIELLHISDKYSAECERDVTLARSLGFSGLVLPTVPNSGGFDLQVIQGPHNLASTRKLVIVKTYGGYFGRASLVLDVVPKLLDNYPHIDFYFYSVTEDLYIRVKQMQNNYPTRIKYSTVSKPISYLDLQNYFSQARVYVGCSISDGISTSLLEALVAGAYPIQTDTSCANEWVSKGASISLFPLENGSKGLYRLISDALENDKLVDATQISNQSVALIHLDSQLIQKKVQEFY
jgi:hypothetical protein